MRDPPDHDGAANRHRRNVALRANSAVGCPLLDRVPIDEPSTYVVTEVLLVALLPVKGRRANCP
jgi:hypothetical protein